MNTKVPHPIKGNFWKSGNEVQLRSLSNGLINETWVATNLQSGEKVLLQKINTSVFPEPTQVVNNHFIIWEHWEKLNSELNFQIAKPLAFSNGEFTITDDNKKVWRIQEYFAAVKCFERCSSVEQIFQTAHSFGQFNKFLWKIPASKIKPTIQQFHDLEFRFKQFLSALQVGDNTRLKKAKEIIDTLLLREKYIHQYKSISSEPIKFPLRLYHHDTKISNLLFKEQNEKLHAIIDLDTVMPGYFFSDLGDMIRSMSVTVSENEIDTNNIYIDRINYKAIVEGYLESIQDELTSYEIEWIHLSGIWIIYMQSLRFLTDYLLKDIYYKITYPDQNYDRANNQLTLLKSLEKMLADKYALKQVLA
jgi:thiamine kinase-like enzyme